MTQVGDVLGAMADGDLTRRIDGDFDGVFGRIKDDTNGMATRLAAIITELGDAAREVQAVSAEISGGSVNLAERTESQAASVEQTAASMNELTVTVKQNAESAGFADQLAATAHAAADRGRTAIDAVTQSMTRIETVAGRIGGIVSLRSEEHTSELQSLMRISYAVFCLKKK